jgi:hypothetical protein
MIWHDHGLLSRADLPQPDFTSVERVLRSRAVSSLGPARDAERLLEMLALSLAGRKATPSVEAPHPG